MKHRLAVFIVVLCVAPCLASQPRAGKTDVERDRKEALRHYRLGEEAFRSERYDTAEEEFHKAGKLDPTLELAPYGLGQVYMATKRYPLAIAAFSRCREVVQSNAATSSGNDLSRQRRINDQIKELEDQQQIYQQPGRNANAPLARNYLQQLEIRIQAMKDARYRTSSGPEPIPAWLSLALGSAYFRTDATADAEREYRAAIAVDPRLGEAHNNLAVVLLLTGRPPEADAEIKAAEKAGFKVNPQLKEDVKKALPPR